MRKGNQVKIVGKHPYCGKNGIVYYSWDKVYRHLTEAEVQQWHDSPSSKGINSAGESWLPPTCLVVHYDKGELYKPSLTITQDEQTLLSNDTFTVVRSRCAPILAYRKSPGMALLRNNRTGEEGYIKRKCVELVHAK
jgi:hypothetical protein